MKHKYESGDLFLLPITTGGVALCQVVSAFKDRFKKVFSFGVLQVSTGDPDFDLVDRDYLKFKNSRGSEQLIFTSADKLKNGEWAIVGHVPLTPVKNELKYFRNSYNLYFEDEFLETLDKSKAKEFNVMGVAGFDLVQSYLSQML